MRRIYMERLTEIIDLIGNPWFQSPKELTNELNKEFTEGIVVNVTDKMSMFVYPMDWDEPPFFLKVIVKERINRGFKVIGFEED